MAEEKETYPMIPEKSWWVIRKQFIQTLPTGGVTTNYLATLLGIGDKAAGNLKPPLRKIRLIDEDDAITERAKQWRDNEQYPKVCNDIRAELYPAELRDLFPNPSEKDKDTIANWFRNRTVVGLAASKMMASFYLLLSKADPSVEVEIKPKAEKTKTEPKEKPKAEIEPKPIANEQKHITNVADNTEGGLNLPSININVEIHISSDADTKQIDQIFESMAKHLNIRRNVVNG